MPTPRPRHGAAECGQLRLEIGENAPGKDLFTESPVEGIVMESRDAHAAGVQLQFDPHIPRIGAFNADNGLAGTP